MNLGDSEDEDIQVMLSGELKEEFGGMALRAGCFRGVEYNSTLASGIISGLSTWGRTLGALERAFLGLITSCNHDPCASCACLIGNSRRNNTTRKAYEIEKRCEEREIKTEKKIRTTRIMGEKSQNSRK